MSIEFENKLSLIIRKPQEGKTFICISSIVSDPSNDIHIIITMNTLKAGMQFFGRMESEIGSDRIIIFNSDRKTAGKCHYAKDINGVYGLIRKNDKIKVIVCCAHYKRFKDSLISLFDTLTDSVYFSSTKKQIKIHIDEGHKYIPENRQEVRNFNSFGIVSKIVGYSASPDPIWVINTRDLLFNEIPICNVEEEYGIIRSNEYFGVKDCEPIIYENELNTIELNSLQYFPIIPKIIMKLVQNEHDTIKFWYGEKFPFNFGNELLYFTFLEHVLPNLTISGKFSYHFVPSYARKITHYQSANIILKYYNDANVIVINGNGIQLFKFDPIIGIYLVKTDREIIVKTDEYKHKLLEPSFVIQTLIEPYRQCPTFVVGFMCVGMSVTLINECLGNFNSIILDHQHYNREYLYQLCRFLFNYTRWNPENKAKINKTKFIALTRKVYDICLDYETHIEKLYNYEGKICSLNEVKGISPIELDDETIKKQDIKSIEGKWGWKRFEINADDKEESDFEWERAMEFYKLKNGKKITNRSIPILENGFYKCSVTSTVRKYSVEEMEKTIIGNKKWDSYFQLIAGKYKYASRLFIGYNDLNDNTKYTIYIKWACLQEDDNVTSILEKYYPKK